MYKKIFNWQTIKTNRKAQQGSLIRKKNDIYSHNKNNPVSRNKSNEGYAF